MSSPRIVVSDTAEHDALVMVDNCPIPFGFQRHPSAGLDSTAMARNYLLWADHNHHSLADLGDLMLFSEHADLLRSATRAFSQLRSSGVGVSAERMFDAATFDESTLVAFTSAVSSIHAACGPEGLALFEAAMAAQDGCDPWAALASVQAELAAVAAQQEQSAQGGRRRMRA